MLFFSCIVTRDGKLWFTEHNNHKTVIMRKGLHEILDAQNFVRLGVIPPFDECTADQIDVPSWFEEDHTVIEDMAIDLAKRVAPHWEEYKKIQLPALIEYKKSQAPDWKKYEEYDNARRPAWEKFVRSIKKIEGYVG
jgi:hypothetical protein